MKNRKGIILSVDDIEIHDIDTLKDLQCLEKKTIEKLL